MNSNDQDMSGEDDMDAPDDTMKPMTYNSEKSSVPTHNLNYGNDSKEPNEALKLLGAGTSYMSKNK